MPFIKVKNGHHRHRGEELFINVDRIINAIPNQDDPEQTVIFMDDGCWTEKPRAYFLDVPFWQFCASLENKTKGASES